MAPNNDDEGESPEQYEQRLRAALWAHVRSMVRQQASGLQTSPTPRFVSGLLEVVWTQIESTSRDLEMFAKHAGRSTINVNDMMLLARRNGGLEDILRTFVDEELDKGREAENEDQPQDEETQFGTKKTKRSSKQPSNTSSGAKKSGRKSGTQAGSSSKKRTSSASVNEPAPKRRAGAKK